MDKDEIVDKISEVRSKIGCMAHFKSDISEDVDYGFYLVMSSINEDLEAVSVAIDKFGEGSEEKLSKLFSASK